MRKVGRGVAAFLKDEGGPTALEYAIMLALIIMVCVITVTLLGSNTNDSLSYSASKVRRTGS